VPVTDKTVITTDTDRTNPTVLHIDEDGDGIVDRELTLNASKPDNPGGDNGGGGDGGNGGDAGSGGGGGGCNAGFGGVAALLLAGLVTLKKRRG
jgi:Synergist-CTERM protein sorting domain-containing protein